MSSSTPVNPPAQPDRAPHDDAANHPHKPSWKEDYLGDNRTGDRKNISWGAVFAGVVTFMALTVLLSLITAALGLGVTDLTSDNPGQGVGVATGISSIITLALALAGGGYVAGLLAGRAGLIHGFLTWATSLLVIVVLAATLIGNILGTAGSVVSGATSAISGAVAQNPSTAASAVPSVNPSEASEAAQSAQSEASQAVENARPQAEQAMNNASAGTMWAFVGLLIGAVIASFAGLFGSRSVAGRPEDRELAGRR